MELHIGHSLYLAVQEILSILVNVEEKYESIIIWKNYSNSFKFSRIRHGKFDLMS